MLVFVNPYGGKRQAPTIYREYLVPMLSAVGWPPTIRWIGMPRPLLYMIENNAIGMLGRHRTKTIQFSMSGRLVSWPLALSFHPWDMSFLFGIESSFRGMQDMDVDVEVYCH